MPIENNPEKKAAPFTNAIKLLLKVAVTVLCFWYIARKIDFAEAFSALNKANWLLFSLAVLAYMLSKLVSAIRLALFFRQIHLRLGQWTNLKLYWLGMFYNLFLPGSISGDAYKVVLLNKRYGAPYKKTSAAVLLDRFSGLLGLGVLLSLYGILVFDQLLYDAVLLGGTLVAIVGLFLVVSKFFPDFKPVFFSTFFGGLLVQAIQVGGVYLILSALGITTSHQQWLFIFLSASIISVLPLSLGGGLGTREVVFAEGAVYFGLDPQLAVIISLLFYVSSVAGAIWGAWFIFHDPLKPRAETSG